MDWFLIMIIVGILVILFFAALTVAVIIFGKPKSGEEIIETVDTVGGFGEDGEEFDFSEREVHCPVCGEEVDPFDEECENCGAIFEPELYECPKCGEDVDPREKICPHCGEILQIEPTVCPHCGEVVHPEATHCDSCGEDFWSPVKLEQKKPRPPRVVEREESEDEEEQVGWH